MLVRLRRRTETARPVINLARSVYEEKSRGQSPAFSPGTSPCRLYCIGDFQLFCFGG